MTQRKARSDAPRLEELGGGLFAYLQPDGSWGLSNAGLVSDGEESLLIDTLYDLPLTQRMLDAMARCDPGGPKDRHARQHPRQRRPLLRQSAGRRRADHHVDRDGGGDERGAALGDGGHADGRRRDGRGGTLPRSEAFGAFDFEGISRRRRPRPSTARLDLRVGDHAVELIEVGPAHTRGDVLDPRARRSTRSSRATSSSSRARRSCGRARSPTGSTRANASLALEPEVVVPGHGPLTDVTGALAVRDYLVYVRDEARKRFDAGLSARGGRPRHPARRLLGLARLRTDRGERRDALSGVRGSRGAARSRSRSSS